MEASPCAIPHHAFVSPRVYALSKRVRVFSVQRRRLRLRRSTPLWELALWTTRAGRSIKAVLCAYRCTIRWRMYVCMYVRVCVCMCEKRRWKRERKRKNATQNHKMKSEQGAVHSSACDSNPRRRTVSIRRPNTHVLSKIIHISRWRAKNSGIAPLTHFLKNLNRSRSAFLFDKLISMSV